MTEQQAEPKDAGEAGIVTAQDEQDIAVSDNGEASRYEVHVDGERAGFAQYKRRRDQINFTHAEIDPAFEGRGIGSRLAKYALDDARSRNLRVVPNCPFIAAYIRSHPEYATLVDG
jgi:predicted GNAT family acetyltransferase